MDCIELHNIPIGKPRYDRKISFGVVFVIFLICPIASLPWIIKGCYSHKKKYYLLASLFLGICALILNLPIADQYRHAITFYKLKGQPFITYYMLSVAIGKIDFIVHLLMYVVNELGLPFGTIRAFLVSVCSYLFLILYDEFCKEYKQIKYTDKKLYFWYIFLLLPIASICSGLRFATSVCLVVYVFTRWDILHKSNLFDYLIIIISIFVHTGIFIAIMLYLLKFLVPNNLNNKNLFLLIVFISLLFASSAFIILQYLPLPYPLNEYVEKFTDGEFANSDYVTNGLNIIGFFQVYLSLYGNLFIIILPLLLKYHFNKNTKYGYLLIILYSLTINMFSLNGRIGMILIIYGGFMILKYWKKYVRKVAICIFVVICILQVINWRKLKYYHYSYFALPIPCLLHADYDEDWINKYVNEKGTLKDWW